MNVADHADPLVRAAAAALLAMQRHSWEQGLAAQAFLELGDADTAFLLSLDAASRAVADGRLALMGDDRGATDSASALEPLLRSAERAGIHAADSTHEPSSGGCADLAASLKGAADRQIEYLLSRAPRAPDGTIYHLTDAKEFWIDSMYMGPPALAAAGFLDEAVRQVDGLRARLFLLETGLYAHRWDDARGWLIRKAAWGVGNGWAAAGMARVIRALPMGSEARDRIVRYVRDHADAWLPLRTPDGLFNDVLDERGTFVETNAAQMLAYALFRGTAEGWLPVSYRREALTLQSAVRAKVDRYGLVRGACGAPRFDSPGVAAEAQAFFLLMSAAASA